MASVAGALPKELLPAAGAFFDVGLPDGYRDALAALT